MPEQVPASAAGLSLYTVVDLALKHAPEIRMAQAELQRAAAGLSEQRDAYVPNFSFASNIGYSYGFPVGQPSVANAQSNSILLSFSQPDYIRSARAAVSAATFSLQDTREKVTLEASLDYVELATDTQEVAALTEQSRYGERLVAIEQERVEAGVDSRVDETQARLTNAQLQVRLLQLRGHAEVLAQRLANLTGMQMDTVVTEPTSIPAPPTTAQLLQPVHEGQGVLSAYAQAKSKFFVAFGDSRQIDRPSLSLGVNYSRYAEFNNYQEYYNRFQHNNFGVGINILIPVFDEARRAHARGSAADAVHATAQADLASYQEKEQRLELSQNLQTLAAQQKVAELEQELAQERLDAVLVELQNGTGHPGAPAPTPKDEQQAHIAERRYTVDLLEAKFQSLQAKLELLRANDEIEAWAMQVPQR